MNAKELERFIMSKPNARKKTVPEWRYIRYTAYSIAFAALQKTEGGAILTVFGRNERLESEYFGVITPAAEHGERFTSITFPNSLPPEVIKQLINNSYAARMRAVSMPDNASGRSSDEQYNGINFGECFTGNAEVKENYEKL